MQHKGMQPNSVIVLDMQPNCVICVSIVAVEEGCCAHQQTIVTGWDSDAFAGSSLVDVYANVAESRMLGDFSTDAILRYGHLGHVKCRKVQKVLELFGQMQHQCMHQSLSLLLLTCCNLEGEFWRNLAFCYDLETSVSFEKKGTCFQNCCFQWFSYMGFFAEASPIQIFVYNHPIRPQKILCACLVCICNQNLLLVL